MTVRKTSGEIWVEIDVWPLLCTLAHIVFDVARVDRFDLTVPYLMYNTRVQPYWKSLMQFRIVRDGGEALELIVVFQPKETPIRTLFDKVRPLKLLNGVETEISYEMFRNKLTHPRNPLYMSMERLMNTLYPEETVNQIWTWTMRELTSASNSYSVEAYPVDAVDGDT